LIRLKQFLLKPENRGRSVDLIFHSESAVNDISYYLDKKQFSYKLMTNHNYKSRLFLVRLKGKLDV